MSDFLERDEGFTILPRSETTEETRNKRFPDGQIQGVTGASSLASQVTDAEVESLADMLKFVCANDNSASHAEAGRSDLQPYKEAYEHSCVELIQTLNALLQLFNSNRQKI